jgi:nucleoside-diphosphate-sugar epimerase
MDAGFVGRRLIKALCDQGMRIAAISRAPVMYDDNEDVRFFHDDIRDAEKLAQLIGDAPFLINAAGPEITDDWADCESKVLEAITVVSNACRDAGVQRLVHLSSIAALYLGNKDEIITGRASVDPYSWQRANYSRARGLEEIALLTRYEESNLPVCILRPAIVVGEDGAPYHADVGTFVDEQRCMGWNGGGNPLPFVLAEDVVSAVLSATEAKGIDGHCYNLAGDVRLCAKEYVAALAKEMGQPLVFHPQSPDMIYFCELMKWSVDRVRGRKALPPSKRELLSRTMTATLDCSDVKAALRWTPVSDRETFIARGIRVHADSGR